MLAPGGRGALGRRSIAPPRTRYASLSARTLRRAIGLRPTSHHDRAIATDCAFTCDGGDTNRRYPTARGVTPPHTTSSDQVWTSPQASCRDDRADDVTNL